MHYHSQNLTDGRLPKILHGRAWLRPGGYDRGREIHWEWGVGKFARDFALTLSFGNGDCESGMLFHICIPWIISVFVGITGVIRCKECRTGIAIHNQALWIYPLTYSMHSSKDDPWYRRYFAFGFPWEYQWHSTEILTHSKNDGTQGVVWKETARHRRDFFATYDERKRCEASVSRQYPYSYILKNREIQHRTATVYVTRMKWRARWWPIIPIQKTSTSIDVSFDKEVGEESGSWKGGVTGCSWPIRWLETPERALSRMEHEREFRRH